MVLFRIPIKQYQNVQTTPKVSLGYYPPILTGSPPWGPNPLIGWRKEICNPRTKNSGHTTIIKNNCYQPTKSQTIQNKSLHWHNQHQTSEYRQGLKGNINTNYNPTSKGYLQKRCRTYEQNAFNFDIQIDNNQTYNFCCPKSKGHGKCTEEKCSYAKKVTYKPNNTQFSTQGAVSNRARINRLQYNTIVQNTKYRKETYWGGQSSRRGIIKSKSRGNCAGGQILRPNCRGQGRRFRISKN